MADQTRTILKGWKITTLGEVAEIFTGRKDVNETDPTGKYIFFSCSPETFCSDEYIRDDDAIIIVGNGSYTGTVRFFSGKFDLYQRTYACVLKSETKDEFNIKFLFYYTKKYFQDNFMGGTRGSSIPYIVRGDIENFEIPNPPLPEQRAIAAVLSSLDDKIELLGEQNKTLKATAQAIFTEWFVNFNFPGACGRMSDSDLGEIPEGWRVGKLAELVEIKNGFAFKSEDYITDRQYPIIRTMNFEDSGYINNESLVYISNKNAEEYKSFNFDEFDLCVVMVGASLGKTAIVNKINLPALQNQNMWCFKPKNKDFRFYNNFQVLDLINLNINSASGSARDFFRKDYFYAIDVLIPPESLIIRFKEIGLPIYSKISNNLSQLQTLSTIRDTLLPKLMKGEIRVEGFKD
jgi:type I restriction enzyme S subunit